MQTSVSITRRLRVAGVDAEDTALHSELFDTFSSYGLIEEILFEEDRDFHSGAVILQFQRLSASERLQSDIMSIGRRWTIAYLQPVPHVGAQLLATSPKSIDTALLRSLVPGDVGEVMIEEKIMQVPHTLSSEAADVATASTAPIVMSSTSNGRGPGRIKQVPTRNECIIRMFLEAISSVRKHAIGKYIAVITFKDANSANVYLANNQATLATKDEVYVTHVGSDEALGRALRDVLLTRRTPKEVNVGSLLRGIVLPQSSSINGTNVVTSCNVDAGLVRKGRTIIVHAKTNFAKVAPWEVVEVKLTSLDLAKEENVVEGELHRVLSTANGGPGGANGQSAFFNCLTRTGISLPNSNNASSGTTGRSGASLPPSKELTSRLYKALQESRVRSEQIAASRELQVHRSTAAEHVHTFPKGLHTLSTVSVCIQRVDDDGLHARIVTPPHVVNSALAAPFVEWPVFIPPMFVPSEGGVHWRDFAVPGERMNVAVLYALSIGGSEAALQLIASKRETEVRRATPITASAALCNQGENRQHKQDQPYSQEQVLLPGTAFTGSRVVWLPNTPSTKGPVYLVLPSSTSPPLLFTLAIFMHAPATAAGVAPPIETRIISLVVSEVVRDAARGHYAVAMEEFEYNQRQQEHHAAKLQQVSEQEERVKRILAETLGMPSEQADDVVMDGNDSPCEGAVGAGRKRQRSPDS
uniref:Uncharacterized protein n=1 Tax=Trypanosoma congolense (strain IL3000) TaxID=1068625 RepID=G0UW15_TRYCI|nr:conserved hypothetical protein [Trypanosoma congolense IL3000]